MNQRFFSLRILVWIVSVFSMQQLFSQDIELYQQFNGRYDYTAFGNTLNVLENGTFAPCIINTSSSADLFLNSNQNIVAAYLYWAGSDDGDFDVELNGIPITAERTFSDALTGDRTFFAAFADVTDIVTATGNGTYTLSELDLTSVIAPYCPTGTNFGGWAITVIYEDASLPLNQLNIYDGLESVPETLEITLDNLNVFDNMGAKIGFIAWEGDQALSVNESLRINGSVISNFPLNPATNAFNGTNSFTGASDLYNMDIDFYSIQNYIAIGDTQATISLTSGQDFVMINNIITVLNSQLPDATVTIDAVFSTCNSRDLVIDYTISNNNSTAALPDNTPITFYADGNVIATDVTNAQLAIGESIQQSILVTISTDVPENFTLMIVVDDDGTGNGTVDEINEDNNTATQLITLPVSPQVPPLPDLEICDNELSLLFDLTQQELLLTNSTNLSFFYYESAMDASLEVNEITNTTQYSADAYPATIYLKVIDTTNSCNTIADFQLLLLESPNVQQPQAITACQGANENISIFDLTSNESMITSDANISYTYYEELTSGGMLQNEITNPELYENRTNPQNIYVNVTNNNGCSEIISFELVVENCEIYIPQGISPNDDGKNDEFTIVNLEAHPNHILYIYNRLGTLIYEGNNATPKWNGYPNRGFPDNEKLPTGTYFYVLYLNDEPSPQSTFFIEQTYTGWIYLQNN